MNRSETEDGEITELFFARNEQAIAETQRKYGKRLLSLSKGIVGSDEDAEECVNDAYLKLWNSIPPEKPENVGAYASGITRNLSIDLLRKNDAQKRGNGALLSELDETIPDTGGSEIGEIALGELIDRFLRLCGSDARRMFLLRYYFGMDFDAIAARLGCSSGKVTSQLQRTRKKLKEYLEKEGVSL